MKFQSQRGGSGRHSACLSRNDAVGARSIAPCVPSLGGGAINPIAKKGRTLWCGRLIAIFINRKPLPTRGAMLRAPNSTASFRLRAEASSPAELTQPGSTRLTISPQNRAAGCAPSTSGRMPGATAATHQSQRGVALVITLIMLSVITFLTVAFLAVSRRDRVAVSNALNQTDSRFMADAALARFQSEVISRMMARNSLLNYDLTVSHNYINPLGFNTGITVVDTNNVNYDKTTTGGVLGNNDQVRNIANLFYDPRVPVYVKTNVAGATDFRFYLDYNRNGRFETNGLQAVLDELGNPILDGNGVGISNFFNGEGEWIGVLQNPELPHGPNNKFIGRYLFLGLPIGKTLDLNHIHNYAKGNIGMPAGVTSGNGDGFLRNEGFGSWELNLGAFLRDLNTNMYPDPEYIFNTASASPNTGFAFLDAVSILGYRYSGNQANLSSVGTLFGPAGQTAFASDRIDGYTTRPVLVPPFVNLNDPDFSPANLTTQPWPGSNNKVNYFTPQEIFDVAKTSLGFNDRLTAVVSSTNKSTYNTYTFSRFLEQMGMGSEPEVKGKINLNYVNDPKLNVVPTNFVEWTPLQFFTNVAERLFRENLVAQVVSPGVTNYFMFNTNDPANLVHAGFSYTNIQIYPINEYSAPVHRLLQVAANVYDATSTNRFPSVFRPQFTTLNGTNYIAGYDTNTSAAFAVNAGFTAWALANTWANRNATNLAANDNVYGVPFIVGAKKGFPSFNKFVMQTSVQISRNLQLKKAAATDVYPNETNQMLVLGISNVFGLEAWNSYLANYTNKLVMLATNKFSMVLTNELGVVVLPVSGSPFNIGMSGPQPLTPYLRWPGARSTNAFQIAIATNINFLPNAQYLVGAKTFKPLGLNLTFERTKEYFSPNWGITMTNQLVYILLDVSDPANQRIVDFVNIDGMEASIDITKELLGSELKSAIRGTELSAVEEMWRTNRVGGSVSTTVPTIGMQNQILASMDNPKLSETDWGSYSPTSPTGPQRDQAVDNFRKFMGFARIYSTNQSPSALKAVQTPFNPSRKLDQTISWQVNDPLVHYMVNDLKDRTNNIVILPRVPPTNAPPDTYLGKLNTRYNPWGGNHPPGSTGKENEDDFAYDLRVKDPRIRWSDDWNFPTNKFPSIGWLGRVHRGTPWQTIYLKAAVVTNSDWYKWAGHFESHPTNDWKLLDVFSAAANDNAARGLLSVNQENMAAWSAALSGMIVLSNSIADGQAKNFELQPPQFQSVVIQPNSDFLKKLIAELAGLRTNTPSGVFNSIGEILAAPSLSVAIDPITGVMRSSPFLNLVNSADQINQKKFGLTDEAYERIPQQLMSLLKLGEPRFVVYCYGQSLKPANNSLVLNPPDKSLFGLCTNYQITGEVVTRTALRVEGTVQNPKVVIESYNILPAD